MSLTASHLTKFLQTAKGFDKVLDGVKIISVGKGNCVAELKVEEKHTNPIEGLHGGFSATLVDVISSYALFSHDNAQTPSVSVDIHMTYLKGAKIGDEIVIDAKTIRAGRTLAFLEVLIKNKATNEALVKGQHTKFILNKQK